MHLHAAPIFLILILGVMSIFGLSFFDIMDHGGNHLCPISLISGGKCPPVNNSFSLAMHHFLASRGLMQSMAEVNVSLLFLLAISLSFWRIFRKLNFEVAAKSNDAQKICRINKNFISSSYRRRLRWLLLRNKNICSALLPGAR